MKECLKTCYKLNVACPISECRHWIDYKEDKNCTFEAIDNNGMMTLREVADRLGLSYVRVKQIQDKAMKKISHFFEDDAN